MAGGGLAKQESSAAAMRRRRTSSALDAGAGRRIGKMDEVSRQFIKQVIGITDEDLERLAPGTR